MTLAPDSLALASVETNALQSMYGGKAKRRAAADALCGNVGGQVRLQETWTPEWILDAARAAMGGIDHDPCAASDPRAWFADVSNVTLPIEALRLEKKKREAKTKAQIAALDRELKPFYVGGSLVCDWPSRRNFVNNPFKWLELWLRKCVEQAEQGKRIVQIGPVRPHRTWWRPLVRTGHLVYLRYDVVFQGHKMAFPAPLALCSWNCVIPWLGERETGRE